LRCPIGLIIRVNNPLIPIVQLIPNFAQGILRRRSRW
jgi:hypothetical protein